MLETRVVAKVATAESSRSVHTQPTSFLTSAKVSPQDRGKGPGFCIIVSKLVIRNGRIISTKRVATFYDDGKGNPTTKGHKPFYSKATALRAKKHVDLNQFG